MLSKNIFEKKLMSKTYPCFWKPWPIAGRYTGTDVECFIKQIWHPLLLMLSRELILSPGIIKTFVQNDVDENLAIFCGTS
jgi:hypothetical protein